MLGNGSKLFDVLESRILDRSYDVILKTCFSCDLRDRALEAEKDSDLSVEKNVNTVVVERLLDTNCMTGIDFLERSSEVYLHLVQIHVAFATEERSFGEGVATVNTLDGNNNSEVGITVSVDSCIGIQTRP